MFETSIISIQAAAVPRRAGLFSASLAFHSFMVVAVLAASIARVEFPSRAPNELALFQPTPVITLPPALGVEHPRPGPAEPARTAPSQPTPSTTPAVTPPTANPDPMVATTPRSDTANDNGSNGSAGNDGPGTGDGVLGVPWGVPNGVPTTDTQPAETIADGPLTPGVGGVQAPRVITRVNPRYPQSALAVRMAGVVTVQCVIGKDGRIREARVIQSSFGVFNQSALDAVNQWTFEPGRLRGSPVDCWFELHITFSPR